MTKANELTEINEINSGLVESYGFQSEGRRIGRMGKMVFWY